MIEIDGIHGPYVTPRLKRQETQFAVVQKVLSDGTTDGTIYGTASVENLDKIADKATREIKLAQDAISRHPRLESFTVIVEGEARDMEPGIPVQVTAPRE